MENIDFIYEDNDIIVCRKPAGIATQTRRLGQPDMESLLRNHLAADGRTPYIGIVHRLDQPVEGVMVYAKNAAAAAHLSQQVAQRQIGKYYYALVFLLQEPSGDPLSTDWTTRTDYMTWNGKTNYAAIVRKDTSGAKKAELEYRLVQQEEAVALLDIRLHTGRHHQIRLQMAHAGMPLVGDRKYGSRATISRIESASGSGSDGFSGSPTASPREALALCAYRLDFIHPATGAPMSFSITPSHKLMQRLL